MVHCKLVHFCSLLCLLQALTRGSSASSSTPSSLLVVAETFQGNSEQQDSTSLKQHRETSFSLGRDGAKEKDGAQAEMGQSGAQISASASIEQPKFMIQQQQERPFTSFLQIDGNPLNSAIKFSLPGLSSDISNTYSLLSNGLDSQYKNLQSNFNGFTNDANNRYEKVSSNFLGAYGGGQNLYKRLYEFLENPQQMCQQLALQSQQALNLAAQQANQAYAVPGNYLNQFQPQQPLPANLNQAAQLGGSFLKSFGFGKR